MGLGGVSIWQLLIIMLIIMLLFGTRRLSSLGADLGRAVRGFKKEIHQDSQEDQLVENLGTKVKAQKVRGKNSL